MSDLTRLTAQELSDGLTRAEFTAEEVTRAHLDRIEAVDGEVHAYLATNETAIEAAKQIDERRAQGEELSPLAGVPIAVKDVLVTTDMPTTVSSSMLEGYRSPFDATVVRNVREAGLIPIGKTNMDEFAMGSTTETSAYGPTHNPWQHGRIPGGSGGGTAAALASFTSPLAFGSDTGGSIRQPAALTGTVGMKPTYGAVSRYGAVALASSLDQIGPAARNVLDTALLHDLIVGYDVHEATSVNRDWESMAEAAREGVSGGNVKGLRVGIVREFQSDLVQPGVRDSVEAAVRLLEANGADIVELEMPELRYAAAAYMVLQPAEASSNLAKFDSVRFGLRVEPHQGANHEEVMSATRAAGFGHVAKRRLLLGTHTLSAGHYDRLYVQAMRARTLVIQAFERVFADVDVIVSPTSPVTAWEIGGNAGSQETELLADTLTVPANLAGIPGISLPVGVAQEDGLPVGAQILAPVFADATLYRVGAVLEQLIADRDGAPFWHSIPALNGKASA